MSTVTDEKTYQKNSDALYKKEYITQCKFSSYAVTQMILTKNQHHYLKCQHHYQTLSKVLGEKIQAMIQYVMIQEM